MKQHMKIIMENQSHSQLRTVPTADKHVEKPKDIYKTPKISSQKVKNKTNYRRRVTYVKESISNSN